MEVGGQIHDPAALAPVKKTPDKRLGGSQSRSGSDGEKENSQPLPEFEPPDQPVRHGSLQRCFTYQCAHKIC
jgi:hypothetical protein